MRPRIHIGSFNIWCLKLQLKIYRTKFLQYSGIMKSLSGKICRRISLKRLLLKAILDWTKYALQKNNFLVEYSLMSCRNFLQPYFDRYFYDDSYISSYSPYYSSYYSRYVCITAYFPVFSYCIVFLDVLTLFVSTNF